MMTSKELGLLSDLLKLLKKYGTESFISLSQSISSSIVTQHLPELLKQVSELSRYTAKPKKEPKSKKKIIPRSIEILEIDDPEKYQILNKFFNELMLKTFLPTLRNLKEFANDIGATEINTKSRKRAIELIINLLSSLPKDQLILKLQSLEKYDVSNRSLLGWTQIILNRKRE